MALRIVSVYALTKNGDNGHKPANSGNTCNSAALCPLCSLRVSVNSFGTIILVICKVGGVLLSKKKNHVCAVRVSFRTCYYHVVDVWLKHHEKSVQLFSKNKIAILLVKIRKKNSNWLGHYTIYRYVLLYKMFNKHFEFYLRGKRKPNIFQN